MKEKVENLLNAISLPPPEEIININEILLNIPFDLPKGYVDFLIKYPSGCEGSLGKYSYLVLWPAYELKENNEMYSVQEFAPELFLIGSAGSDTAYGFNIDTLEFIKVPFIGMSLEESEVIDSDFDEFIEKLTGDT